MWLNNVASNVINNVIDVRARVDLGEMVEHLATRPAISLIDGSEGD